MTDGKLDKILHVEDEPDIQTIARMTLETLGGFTVQTCSSGQDAIVAAPKFAPDLILLDVMMPGMDGPTTLEELRKLPETRETPIVFMTAKAQVHEVEGFKALGAIDVVTKPFDPATLCDVLREIWDRRNG